MNLTDEQALEAAKTAQTVAVIGMTDGKKPGRPSFEIPNMMQQRGIRVVPINPRIEEALGETSLGSPADMTEVPDIIDVFRRPDAIPEIADELLALDKSYREAVVWLQSGITNPEAEKKMEDGGYKVVSDRCLGVYVARSGR